MATKSMPPWLKKPAPGAKPAPGKVKPNAKAPEGSPAEEAADALETKGKNPFAKKPKTAFAFGGMVRRGYGAARGC